MESHKGDAFTMLVHFCRLHGLMILGSCPSSASERHAGIQEHHVAQMVHVSSTDGLIE